MPFLSYLGGSKSVSARPSDPNTMANTALDATASSSGKKLSSLNVVGYSLAALYDLDDS